MGQGLVMVIAQCAAEELGMPYERVRVLLSDRTRRPTAPDNASRQTYVTGNAARLAASTLRRQWRRWSQRCATFRRTRSASRKV